MPPMTIRTTGPVPSDDEAVEATPGAALSAVVVVVVGACVVSAGVVVDVVVVCTVVVVSRPPERLADTDNCNQKRQTKSKSMTYM